MAFERNGLCRIGGSGVGGATWQYSTAEQTATVVGDTNYFAPAKDELAAGDVSADGGVPEFGGGEATEGDTPDAAEPVEPAAEV